MSLEKCLTVGVFYFIHLQNVGKVMSDLHRPAEGDKSSADCVHALLPHGKHDWWWDKLLPTHSPVLLFLCRGIGTGKQTFSINKTQNLCEWLRFYKWNNILTSFIVNFMKRNVRNEEMFWKMSNEYWSFLLLLNINLAGVYPV